MSKSKFDWKEFLIDSSRILVDISVELVEKQPELFDSLFEVVLNYSDKNKLYIFSQRAARILARIVENNPERYKNYIDIFLNYLEEIQDDSIRFSFLKIFTVCDLPKDEEKISFLTNICYSNLESQTKRIAVKIYSIEILYRISEIYPEMKNELRSILEIYMIDAQKAFITRANKMLKKL